MYAEPEHEAAEEADKKPAEEDRQRINQFVRDPHLVTLRSIRALTKQTDTLGTPHISS